MDLQTKKALQSLVFAVLYVILFLILLPPLMKVLGERWGQILYGILVAGAVGVALRLRWISRGW